ncbi:MAG TPA: NifB/NifX family molybdenum-iron cluster-binding protein [Desulfobacteraceae bacterium]|nr:NifB/NifX family molybdenum-iron cluster-binding protein [Desulfobacteraceae bacterium]HPJ69095.1 NifB/NifX family molybdenum-iron cluster-binding protein [Desulfobacteraceae bacterium]HPQ29691.1 NifB/NifX family molybdenum-iron cluster-binding protein [Desulfobacteraceae bacterium]
MKIAVTTSGESLDAPLDPRFGRAKKFLLYDTDSGKFELIDNVQNLNAPQGAGIQAAQNVSRLGAEVVITGNCGPKAYKTLTAAGIKVVIEAEGSVVQAIEQFRRGELKPAETANVEGHW